MKYKKYILYAIIGLLVGLVGRVFINDSTLFVNTNQAVPEHYLSINDYVMIDKDSKQAVNKIKCINFEYQNDSYGYNSNLQTTKGIDTNSSWDEFVDAYGDYYVSYIICNKIVDGSEDYSEEVYLDNVLLSDFQRDYIETDKVNLDEYNIVVDFSVYTKLNKIYYLESQAYDYDDNFFWKVNLHRFNLHFSYECKNYKYNEYGINIFDFISSDRT